MTDERYKQIMADLGMPDSRSLLMALQQVANEVAQECGKRWAQQERNPALLAESTGSVIEGYGSATYCVDLPDEKQERKPHTEKDVRAILDLVGFYRTQDEEEVVRRILGVPAP